MSFFLAVVPGPVFLIIIRFLLLDWHLQKKPLLIINHVVFPDRFYLFTRTCIHIPCSFMLNKVLCKLFWRKPCWNQSVCMRQVFQGRTKCIFFFRLEPLRLRLIRLLEENLTLNHTLILTYSITFTTSPYVKIWNIVTVTSVGVTNRVGCVIQVKKVFVLNLKKSEDLPGFLFWWWSKTIESFLLRLTSLY